MPSAHRIKVEAIAAVVKDCFHRRVPFRIDHGSTNSTRPMHQTPMVDITSLSGVIEINPKTRTAIVEPNVPMDVLVRSTLKERLIPPVVMEFPGITSSSFKWGYFGQTIQAIEMVLGDGEIVTASRTERSDLFAGAVGTLGTLGITTRLDVSLIEAREFVKTTYHRVDSVEAAIQLIKREINNMTHDYVDSIMFSKTHGVVITGQLTDDMPKNASPQTFSKPWDPWYYLHVKEKTRLETPPELLVDYVPLTEYLFRYDRGGFWVGVEAFRYFGFPFNRITRWLLNDFMHTRMLYRALHGSSLHHENIIQDLSPPYSTAGDFIDYTAAEFDIWPLWLCPLRGQKPPTFHPSSLSTDEDYAEPMLNIGLRGKGKGSPSLAKNKRLEKTLVSMSGRKILYAEVFWEHDEFWSLYPRLWYEKLRDRYRAVCLPTVFDKVQRQEAKRKQSSWRGLFSQIWPIAGIVGIVRAIRSKDYLLHRQGR
ncbi:FAD-binding domain-containing protein [Cadophora sp. DSE1049]|nr:FAD-binding domain-containing protein [Cadophora sp. DSE1049]